MAGHSDPNIRCILCDRPLDLQTDLNADENGRAVHEECYRQTMQAVNSSTDVHGDLLLLARIRLGDPSAMASLYDRHSTLVYSVALRVCRDSALAEKVLQNLFTQIWQSPQNFASTPGALRGRLAVLSRNLAMEVRRQRQSQPVSPIRDQKSSGLTQKPRAPALPPSYSDRQLLEIAFFDGITALEMARQTGLTVGAIAVRLRRALSALHREETEAASFLEETGLEVFDLDTHPEFMGRSLHRRDLPLQVEGLRRLTHSFVKNPDSILQELVNAAVELCGADSAGVSLETREKTDTNYYHWVAAAGQYNGFLNAVLPRYPSACGICLERGRPQLFRVHRRFFAILGIEAPLVTDGILLPWQAGDTRGTIFIMAHGRSAAFDKDDGQMMRVLADFAALAVRQQRQQQSLLQQAKSAASAAMASKLAHHMNSPLQSLIHTAYLAAEGQSNQNAKTLGRQLSTELRRLFAIVNKSLISPGDSPGQN